MRDPNFADKLANDFSLRLRVEEQRRRLDRPAESRLTPTPMANQRSSAASLDEFKMLPSMTTLLLFTPVTKPTGYLAHQEQAVKPTIKTASVVDVTVNVDPFEMLGRALSKFHRRVRHVPYVPSIGFTETHDLFLREADAVIVVTCMPAEPSEMGAASPSSSALVSIFNQAHFVEYAIGALENVDVPLVILHFGPDDDERWGASFKAYNPVRVSDKYDSGAVERAVELLFAGTKLLRV